MTRRTEPHAPANRRRPSSTLLARLIEHGFTDTEATQWLDLADNSRTVHQEVIDTARRYREAAIPSDRAREWFGLGINPAEAQHNEASGWHPHHVWRLRRDHHTLVHPDGHARFQPWSRIPQEHGWIATQIDPDDVHLYLRAGHNPAAADHLEIRRRAGDPTIEPGLTTLAALRNTHPWINP